MTILLVIDSLVSINLSGSSFALMVWAFSGIFISLSMVLRLIGRVFCPHRSSDAFAMSSLFVSFTVQFPLGLIIVSDQSEFMILCIGCISYATVSL